MKRFTGTTASITLWSTRILACVCCLAATIALSPVLAAPAGAAYEVVEIAPHGAGSSSYSVGINARGDVVGEIGTESPVPFLYRNGHFARLMPLTGVTQALATGINDSDVISVQAIGANGDSAAFAVRPHDRSFTWIPLKTGSLHCNNLYVANVAEDGDIDGGLTLTVRKGDRQLRSVIWRVKPNGTYQDARLLPMSPGFVATVAGGIWYRNGTDYVAGAQGDGGSFQEASLWSPSPSLTYFPHQMPFVSTVGGTSNHVYAAGTTRSSTFSAWVSNIAFDKAGMAQLQSVDILPTYAGYDEAVGTGVSVASGGSVLVVGDIASSTNLNVRGVIWVNGDPAAQLGSLIGNSPWTVTEAAGVNNAGEIAATGLLDNVQRAILLRPSSLAG